MFAILKDLEQFISQTPIGATTNSLQKEVLVFSVKTWKVHLFKRTHRKDVFYPGFFGVTSSRMRNVWRSS
jgi:hypothetical protein